MEAIHFSNAVLAVIGFPSHTQQAISQSSEGPVIAAALSDDARRLGNVVGMPAPLQTALFFYSSLLHHIGEDQIPISVQAALAHAVYPEGENTDMALQAFYQSVIDAMKQEASGAGNIIIDAEFEEAPRAGAADMCFALAKVGTDGPTGMPLAIHTTVADARYNRPSALESVAAAVSGDKRALANIREGIAEAKRLHGEDLRTNASRVFNDCITQMRGISEEAFKFEAVNMIVTALLELGMRDRALEVTRGITTVENDGRRVLKSLTELAVLLQCSGVPDNDDSLKKEANRIFDLCCATIRKIEDEVRHIQELRNLVISLADLGMRDKARTIATYMTRYQHDQRSGRMYNLKVTKAESVMVLLELAAAFKKLGWTTDMSFSEFPGQAWHALYYSCPRTQQNHRAVLEFLEAKAEESPWSKLMLPLVVRACQEAKASFEWPHGRSAGGQPQTLTEEQSSVLARFIALQERLPPA